MLKVAANFSLADEISWPELSLEIYMLVWIIAVKIKA